jgi:hypothetical protein
MPSCYAVYGMPGIGKTQLVLRFAKLLSDQQRYTHVFWISAASVVKIYHGLSDSLDIALNR